MEFKSCARGDKGLEYSHFITGKSFRMEDS